MGETTFTYFSKIVFYFTLFLKIVSKKNNQVLENFKNSFLFLKIKNYF